MAQENIGGVDNCTPVGRRLQGKEQQEKSYGGISRRERPVKYDGPYRPRHAVTAD